MNIFELTKAYTLAGIERCFALYQAVQYIVRNRIPGDLVECGVWKGGSAMIMAYTLQQEGDASRRIFLYDTFEGMVSPGAMDGELEKKEWEEKKNANGGSNWCYSPFEEVMANMRSTKYPSDRIEMVKGRVENSIPGHMPSQLALLRLDTDWYESTKHELVHLFPILSQKGVLIIDDYGAWQGARKATDEFFHGQAVFLQRIDWTARLVIK
jgi:O-methyltransferase